MRFIGQERFVNGLRIDFYDDASGVLGAFECSIDAPEWVPSGGCTATSYQPESLQELTLLACVPRGFSFWSYPLCKDNADMKKDDKIKTVKIGGKRVGSGRKALDSDGTIVTTVRLTAKQKATLDMLGGGSWLRQQLDLFIEQPLH